MADRNWKKKIDSISKKKRKTFIQFLLDAGLDVNALNKYGKTMMSYAAESGDMKIVKFLERKGADGNVVNSDGSKPLHIAAQFGHKDIVNFFLKKGIPADSFDNDKCTPLHYVSKQTIPSAGRESCQKLVHLLVDHNADLDVLNRKGLAPLLLAAQNSLKHIVELFIELGANIDCCDEAKYTVLHYSALNGWLEVVQSVVAEGRIDIDLNAKTSEGYTALHLAAGHSNKDIVELLIKWGADVNFCNEEQWTLLHYSCMFGWTKIVKSLLVEGKIDIDLNARTEEGCTPLQLAASSSNKDIVKMLIEFGANIDSCDENQWTVLHYSCRFGWTEIVQSLVEGRIDIDLNARTDEDYTPLHLAASNSNRDFVELFIKLGATVNSCDEDLWTLLHCSCIYGWKEIVQSFMENKFNIQLYARMPKGYDDKDYYYGFYDKDHWTVLHYSCRNGWLDIVKYLANTGCDLNNTDCYGRTPLVIAAEYSHSSIVEYLIESKCNETLVSLNLEGRDYYIGYTVLHYACEKGWLDTVRSLIKKGSDPNAQTVERDTPLHVAVNAYNTEIVKHLLETSAKWNLENSFGRTAFHECISSLLYLKGIILFIENGAHFESKYYNVINDTPLLKKGILQDVKLCTRAVINQFNNIELPKIYKIPVVAERLPSIEKLKISIHRNVAKNIAESVKYEIQTKGYCDLLKVQPSVLSTLCLRSLVEYYNN